MPRLGIPQQYVYRQQGKVRYCSPERLLIQVVECRQSGRETLLEEERRGQEDAVRRIGRNLRKFKEQEGEGSWSIAKHRAVRRKGHGLYRGLFIETPAVHLPSAFWAVLVIPPR